MFSIKHRIVSSQHTSIECENQNWKMSFVLIMRKIMSVWTRIDRMDPSYWSTFPFRTRFPNFSRFSKKLRFSMFTSWYTFFFVWIWTYLPSGSYEFETILWLMMIILMLLQLHNLFKILFGMRYVWNIILA